MADLERELRSVLGEMLATPRHGDVARLIEGVDFSVVKTLDRLVSRGLLSRTVARSGFTDRTWIVYRTTTEGRILGKRLLAAAKEGGGDALS